MNQQDENVFGVKHMIGILSWMLWGVIGAARTVQIFARVPGTCGLGYFGFTWLLGFFIMLTVPQMFIPVDTINPAVLEMPRTTYECYVLVVAASLIMSGLHFWMTLINRLRGRVIHSYEPGIAWPAKPRRDIPNPPSMQTCRIVSDFLLSASIGMLCFLADTPTLGWWFCAVTPISVVATQALIAVRDDRRVQQVDDSVIDGQIMSGYVDDRYDNIRR